MLSLKAPAKRSTEAVEDWFEGRVTNAKTKEKEEVGNGPQFYPDSAMSRLYQAGDRTGKGDGKMPIDLVSLHPPGDDDPLSKKISKSSWTFRLLKVRFGTGSAGVAKDSLGPRHVRLADYLRTGKENSQMGDVIRARGCDLVSYSGNMGYLGYPRAVVRGQAGRADRICCSLWRMGQLCNNGDKIRDFCFNGSLCCCTCGICWKGVICYDQIWKRIL